MSNKLTKTVIKDIVKECLIEILAEGLASNSTELNSNRSSKKSRSLKEAMNQNTVQQTRKKAKLPSYLEDVDRKTKTSGNTNNLLKIEKLNEIASNLTNDPILAEMLVDTAQTTLQEQTSAESNKHFVPTGNGDQAQKAAASKEPEELFGAEAASKWASLAFG